MTKNLIPVTSLVSIEGEPRIRDVDLAERLEFGRVTSIRILIARNAAELELYGSLHRRDANPGKQGGRPGKAYYLNEGQALVICALSRTPVAARIRKALVDVFMAYRQGKIVYVKEHYRKPPTPKPAPVIEQWGFHLVLDGNSADIQVNVPSRLAADFAALYGELRYG